MLLARVSRLPKAIVANPSVRLAVSVIDVGAKDPVPLNVLPSVKASDAVQAVPELLVNVAPLFTAITEEELMLPPEIRSVPAQTVVAPV